MSIRFIRVDFCLPKAAPKPDRRGVYYGNWKKRVQIMVRRARSRAKERGVQMELTVESVLEKLKAQNYCCARTGIPFFIDDHDPDRVDGLTINPWAPSLDCINPRGGYTERNVQLVCWIYNNAKQTASDRDVMLFAHSLLQHRARGSERISEASCPEPQ